MLPRDEKLLPPLLGWRPQLHLLREITAGTEPSQKGHRVTSAQSAMRHPYHWYQMRMASLLPPVTPIVQTCLEAKW